MTTDAPTKQRWLERDRLTPKLAEAPLVYVRILLGVIGAALLGFGAVVAMFIGAVVTTGCFISCDGANPVVGIPILLIAAVAATLALLTLWWGFVDRHWVRAIVAIGSFGIVGAIVLIAAVLLT